MYNLKTCQRDKSARTSYLIIWRFSVGINLLWLLQSTENLLPMKTLAQKGLFSTRLALF